MKKEVIFYGIYYDGEFYAGPYKTMGAAKGQVTVVVRADKQYRPNNPYYSPEKFEIVEFLPNFRVSDEED